MRQCCKALANLAVNNENKSKIAEKHGILPLIRIIGTAPVSVQVEAVAAIANLAVLGEVVVITAIVLTYNDLIFLLPYMYR